MKEMLDGKALEGIAHYGDAAAKKFFALLEDRKFQTTRCAACEAIAFPPREFCPDCGHREVSWVDLPTRGTLYAFTLQDRAVRLSPPNVVGLVELEGVGRVFTHVRGEIDQLNIGDTVELDFEAISDDLVLHAFKPV